MTNSQCWWTTINDRCKQIVIPVSDGSDLGLCYYHRKIASGEIVEGEVFEFYDECPEPVLTSLRRFSINSEEYKNRKGESDECISD